MALYVCVAEFVHVGNYIIQSTWIFCEHIKYDKDCFIDAVVLCTKFIICSVQRFLLPHNLTKINLGLL